MNSERSTKLVIAVAALCLVLASMGLAVDPPPDGGYANQNTAEGDDALFSLTTGTANTAIGFDCLYANTTGSFNTAVGEDALLDNVVGNHNTAVGGAALLQNLASDNTGVGFEALPANTTGPGNTATGELALGTPTQRVIPLYSARRPVAPATFALRPAQLRATWAIPIRPADIPRWAGASVTRIQLPAWKR